MHRSFRAANFSRTLCYWTSSTRLETKIRALETRPDTVEKVIGFLPVQIKKKFMPKRLIKDMNPNTATATSIWKP